MNTKNIKLATIADVRDFVAAVASFDGDIDLSSGRYVVDGKSIMGIFSLDLMSPIKMDIRSGNAEELLAKVERFIVD